MSAAGSRVGACRALFLPKALVAKGSAHFKAPASAMHNPSRPPLYTLHHERSEYNSNHKNNFVVIKSSDNCGARWAQSKGNFDYAEPQPTIAAIYRCKVTFTRPPTKRHKKLQHVAVFFLFYIALSIYESQETSNHWNESYVLGCQQSILLFPKLWMLRKS